MQEEENAHLLSPYWPLFYQTFTFLKYTHTKHTGTVVFLRFMFCFSYSILNERKSNVIILWAVGGEVIIFEITEDCCELNDLALRMFNKH